jgi:uncharacterized delta-60 repeat protein
VGSSRAGAAFRFSQFKETSLMLQTLHTLCLTRSGKAAKRSASRRRPAFHRPSCRPRLEALEERCLLSAGALDPTFGNGAGYVTTTLTNSNDDALSALIQPDGKIIAVGQAGTITRSRGLYQETYAVGLVRYNTDGSLDTSFGNAGKVIGPASDDTQFIHAAHYPTEGTANDGKIVVGGISGGFAIVRFNANGTLDTKFGTNGIATAPFAATSSYDAFFEVIQPDGKIVALGQTADNTQGELARFNPDGSLDTTFGQGGMVAGPVPNPYSLLLQADGKLVMLGTNSGDTGGGGAGTAGAEMEMARYNADGTLDTSFGSSGIVTNSSLYEADAGAIYPIAGTANDRKIVVEGPGKSSGLELARYNPDGSLDTTFGNGGLAATPAGHISSDQLNSQGVVIRPDGRIVVTSDGNHGTTLAVARCNIDGSLDSTFGSGGIVTTSIGIVSESYAVALQSNGAIVVAGFSNNGTQDVFAVARYLGGPTSGPAFGVTGFPSNTTAGVAQTITVTAEDASGNPNTGYTGTIHFSSSDLQAGLPADYTFAPGDQGVHRFTVTLKTAGFQSVKVTDVSTGYSGGDGATTISPAAASSFVVSGFPTSIIQGTAGTFTVTAMDPYGNVATGYTGTVTFSSSDPLASLPANYTFTAADAGVHTFSATLNTVATESLTVTDILDAAITGTETGIVVTRRKH